MTTATMTAPEPTTARTPAMKPIQHFSEDHAVKAARAKLVDIDGRLADEKRALAAAEAENGASEKLKALAAAGDDAKFDREVNAGQTNVLSRRTKVAALSGASLDQRKIIEDVEAAAVKRIDQNAMPEHRKLVGRLSRAIRELASVAEEIEAADGIRNAATGGRSALPKVALPATVRTRLKGLSDSEARMYENYATTGVMR